MSTAGQTAIKAAMSVAKDIAEGRIAPAQLADVALTECRSLFGAVVGPADPLWPLQAEVARQVLAAGGVPANELQEWLAVQRQRDGFEPRPTPWFEPLLAALADDEPDACLECLAGVCTEHEGGLRWVGTDPPAV